MLRIEIDRITGNVPVNCNVIEAATYLGVDIPRFCYHKKLSIAANCRMCLVEISGVAKLMPACATKVQANMKIFTKTPTVMSAQKAVMEFLLLNHPLDCPICDQGGECELQDISFKYGSSKTRFFEDKRVLVDHDIGPIVTTNMNRCILCTRCIRFGIEVAGICDFGKIGRGVHSKIKTFLDMSLRSNISGNVVDLCPVGALCSKPFKFKARPWELRKKRTISLHDCMGSNLYAHVKDGVIYRITPKENDYINETWLTDKDRHGYEGVYSSERLREPSIKKNGVWCTVSLVVALQVAANSFLRIIERYGAHSVGGVVSPNASFEEFFLFQKILRSLGISNIDHRLTEVDFGFYDKNVDFFPGFIDLMALEKQNVVVLVGSDLSNEQPLISTRIVKQKRSGGLVYSISKIENKYTFPVDLYCSGKSIVEYLCGILKHLYVKQSITNDITHLDNVVVGKEEAIIAESLLNTRESVFLLGYYTKISPEYSTILHVCGLIGKVSRGTRFAILQEGANSLGGILSDCVPDKNLYKFSKDVGIVNKGLNTFEMFENSLKGYCLFGIEPSKDISYSEKALSALAEADFVVSFSAFDTPCLRKTADVIIPISTFYEYVGTYISITGRLQESTAVSTEHLSTDSLPGWLVLNEFARFLNLQNFKYTDSLMVTRDVLCRLEDFKYSWCNVAHITLTDGLVFTGVVADKKEGHFNIPTDFLLKDSVARRSPTLRKVV